MFRGRPMVEVKVEPELKPSWWDMLWLSLLTGLVKALGGRVKS